MHFHLRTVTYPEKTSQHNSCREGLEDLKMMFFLLVDGRVWNRCIFRMPSIDPKMQVQTLVQFATPGTQQVGKQSYHIMLALPFCMCYVPEPVAYFCCKKSGGIQKTNLASSFPNKTYSFLRRTSARSCLFKTFPKTNNKSNIQHQNIE